MKRALLYVIAVLLLMSSQAMAQSRTIKGKVVAMEDDSPLPGVNIVVKGSTKGTITDIDGNYTISVTDADETLIFSFVGFAQEEVTIGSQSVIDVALSPDMKQLQEFVVTGYGNVSKNAFSGSAGTVEAKTIGTMPVTSPEQALQGNVAGLQLSATSGTPGSQQNLRIRGVSSISINNEPLFVIDNVPVVSGQNQRSDARGSLGILSTINPNDIESITVLKDATATALYGARGANGVIIIKTKSGASGKTKFSFSSQIGTIDRAVEGPKMLNAKQWDELYYEARVNSGQASSIDEAKKKYDSKWDGVTDTDWKDVIKNDNPLTQTYNLSATGGNEKTTYFASGGYFSQDGINIGTGFERISGKLNLTQDLSDKIKLTTISSASYSKQKGQLEGSSYFGNPEMSYMFLNPTEKAYDEKGEPNKKFEQGIVYNPLYVQRHAISRRTQSRISNNSTLNIELIENLNFTSTLGLDYLLTEELYYNDPYYGESAKDGGSASAYNNRNFNWVWKNMLDYTLRVTDNHKFNFKAVYEAQKNKYNTLGSGGTKIGSSGLYYPSSVAKQTIVSGYINDWAINSVMGMVNYTYKGNLFLDASVRSEGNSRFARGHRWGTFYSVGSSWVFSDEAFMQGLTWLNTSKLRVSYGKTGNSGVDLNQYQLLLTYGHSYDSEPGSSSTAIGNEKLTWETSSTLNLALDYGFFDIFSGSVEYFVRKNEDLLLDVPLSYTTGFSSQFRNVGSMENKGIEMTLNADLVSTDKFSWSFGCNFTSVKNKVTGLPNDQQGEEIGIVTGTRIVTKDHPVYSWYMPTWAGVDANTGDPLWYVKGTSGETTSTYSKAEKSFHGSAAPTFYGGANTRLEFMGVYLSANVYYSTGNKVFDSWGGYALSDGLNTFTNATGYASQYNRWQKPGDVAPNPKVVYGNKSHSNSNSTRRLYNDEFLRLRTVSLGYNFPTDLVSKLKLTGVNIYVSGTNLWTWTKDKNMEFDPEVKPDGLIELNAPPLKSAVVGLKVDF